MRVVRTIAEVREYVAAQRAARTCLALVPTMGGLHRGHLALIDAAAKRTADIMASLFINPLQFDREDDFRSYPRTPDADLEQLRARGVSLAFVPAVEEMYPARDDDVRVEPGKLGEILCGAGRPGHFAGVVTVVVKLFNIFTPDIALFGEKDYQQLVLIRRLAERFDFGVEIVAVPTVRDEDGVALSSRNALLNKEDRTCAPALYRVLRETADAIGGAGSESMEQLERNACTRLEREGFRPEYVRVCNARTLAPAAADDAGRDGLVVLAAAWLGNVRLIDNVVLK